MTAREWLARARALWRTGALSPGGLLQRAAVLAALFGVAHLAGLREHTAVLSGTRADPSLSLMTEGILAATYLVLYFSTVVVVPILVAAAGICFVLLRLRARRPGKADGRREVDS